MAPQSAGILLYQASSSGLRLWLGHMGGPFWARKDAHAWSIPKGEYEAAEEPLAAALREFHEEMGAPAPDAEYAWLGDFRQPSGKVVTAFAAEADFQPARISSNTFPLEWPKGSGVIREFPEIDDARWFTAEEAVVTLVRGQIPILRALEARIRASRA